MPLNKDVRDLIDHRQPAEHLIGGLQDRVDGLIKRIAKMRPDELPHTVGIFGTWGSGKTTWLAYLAEQCVARHWPVIYFNAWRYAGSSQIVAALIYRLVEGIPENKQDAAKQRLTSILLALAGRHSDRFCEWLELKVGVNVKELAVDLKKGYDAIKRPELQREELLKQYLCEIDEIEQNLVEICRGVAGPIVLLIDELDRCDPGEALEVMKQVRVLLGARGLPIVYVLAANPEPIGLAIKHQYGLDSPRGDYESRRILEKFVDTYVDVGGSFPLQKYIKHLWQNRMAAAGKTAGTPAVANTALIVGLDEITQRGQGRSYYDSTVSYATALECCNFSHPLLRNLRLLRKSLDAVPEDAGHPWTMWHLEILNQADSAFRARVKRLAHEIKEITHTSLLLLLRVLNTEGQIKDGRFNDPLVLAGNEASTPFSVYRSFFWQATRKKVMELEGPDGSPGELRALLDDLEQMEFVISTSLVQFGETALAVRILKPQAEKLSEAIAVAHYNPDQLMQYFGWLLANY